MHISYPRSFVSQLILGFTVVAAPLVFALFANAVSIEKLAALSEETVVSAVKVTQASRTLTATIAPLERTARQYAVAGELPFLDAYASNRLAFQAALRALREMRLSETQRAEVSAITELEGDIHNMISSSPPSAALSDALVGEYARASGRAQDLEALGNRVIDESIERLREHATESRKRVFWLLVALVPTAMVLIASFTFLLARPIRQVRAGIRRLGDGEFARPIEIDGPRDMVRLGEQLDWLRRRLLALEAQKTRFLRHISHELKTPLTALREGSDLLSSGVVGNLNAEQREIARILREKSIELRKLIEGLLNFSAAHAQASVLDRKIVQLSDIVRRVVNDRKLAMVTKGIRVQLNCENVTAYCDEEKIRIILDNLVSNATNFSPEGGCISVKLYKDRSDVVFEVIDEGPGIPAKEREMVFEAFYRGSLVPNAAVKGTGLGLSIVKEYVQLHNGRVELLDSPGAHFRIRIPGRREQQEAA